MSDDSSNLTCVFDNETALYQAYMPFVKGGGLFIRTKATYALGALVHLNIQFFTEDEVHHIDAKVVWITPKGAQGNKPVGIGVQFLGDNARYLCNKIETYLAGMLKSTQATDTL